MPQLAIALGAAGLASGTAGLLQLGASATQMFVSTAFTAGTFLGRILFPEQLEGPRQSEFRATDSTPGAPIPLMYGTFRLGGNLMHSGEVQEISTSSKVGIGTNITEYAYFQTLGIGLNEGVIQDVLAIWAYKDLIFDKRVGNTGPVREILFTFNLYTGTETQLPDSDLWSDVDEVDAHTAYRGLAYIVFPNFPLSEFGNAIPQFEFLVVKDALVAFPSILHNPIWTAPDGEVFDTSIWFWTDPYTPWDTYVYASTGGLNNALIRMDSISGDILAATKLYQGDEFFPPESITGNTYHVPPITNPANNFLFMMHQTALTSKMERYRKQTLRKINESDTSDGITFTTQYHRMCTTFSGSVAVAIGSHPVFGAGEIFIWDPINNITAFARYGDLSSDQQPSSGRPISCTFDDTDNLWLGTDGGVIARYIISVDIENDTIFLIKDSEYDYDSTVSSPSSIGDLAYDYDTQELIVWVETSSANQEGLMFRYSVRNKNVTTTPLSVTYSIHSPFVANQDSFKSSHRGFMTTTDPFTVGIKDDATDTIQLVDTLSGDIINYPLANWSGPSAGANDMAIDYNPFTETFWRSNASNGGFYRLLIRGDRDAVTLETILNDLSSKVGMSSDMYDFTAQTQQVVGFVVDHRMPAKSAIQSLRPAYFFDVIEQDWQLVGVNRGGAIISTIADDDLGASDRPDNRTQRLITPRINDKELPERIDTRYFDCDRDFLISTEPARRSKNSMWSGNPAVIDLPVVLDADEAATISTRNLFQSWGIRESHQFTIGPEYIKLLPTDRINVIRGSNTYEMRITDIEVGANMLLEIKAESEDSGLYSITAKGADNINNFNGQSIEIGAPVDIFIMDTNLLRQSDDSPGFYAAGAPVSPSYAFRGAVIQRSPDMIEWSDMVAAPKAITYGISLVALPPPPDLKWTLKDDTNVLVFTVLSGTFLNATTTEILTNRSKNTILVGDEIIQYETITNIDGNVYQLSGLYRGRVGTESFISGHTSGEDVILLEHGRMASVEIESSELDQVRWFRGRTKSLWPSSSPEEVTQISRRLMPYAPYFIQAIYDTPDTGDITITWLRRSRISGGVLASSPLFESIEDYEIDILNTDNTVARVLTTTLSSAGSGVTSATSRTAVYKRSDIESDLLSISPSAGDIDIQIFQMNDIRGRGYPGKATV